MYTKQVEVDYVICVLYTQFIPVLCVHLRGRGWLCTMCTTWTMYTCTMCTL